jgi:hypothetical protein
MDSRKTYICAATFWVLIAANDALIDSGIGKEYSQVCFLPSVEFHYDWTYITDQLCDNPGYQVHV